MTHFWPPSVQGEHPKIPMEYEWSAVLTEICTVSEMGQDTTKVIVDDQ